MCSVSAIGDNYKQRFPENHPWYDPFKPLPPVTLPYIPPSTYDIYNGPTREEFEALKKEIEELKTLLAAAQKFDAATGQPHCEQDDKVAFLKKIAEWVGVDLNEVLK